MEKETKIIIWEQNFLYTTDLVSTVKRGEYVNDRLSYTVLRGRWCNIIVLNAHASSEEKCDYKKSFYEQSEQVFNHFP
jgi:hypothetical protein